MDGGQTYIHGRGAVRFRKKIKKGGGGKIGPFLRCFFMCVCLKPAAINRGKPKILLHPGACVPFYS